MFVFLILEQFSCFEWSHSETHLLYVAEKKRPKVKSFFDKKPTDESAKLKETEVKVKILRLE